MRIFLLLLLWIMLGFGYRYIAHNHCCTPEPKAIDPGPLLFRWSDAKPVFGQTWPSYKDSLLRNTGKEQRIEITGFYRTNEVNNSTFANLGLARADMLRRDLGLDSFQVNMLGKVVEEMSTDQTSPFKSASFKYVLNSSNLKQVDDKMLIYFPPSSDDKINNTEIENYLNDVADKLKQGGGKVSIIGHTDSQGDAPENYKLGLRRAKSIRDYLLDKGVPAESITTDSKGEEEPIGDNRTEAGRQQNRRTELILK